MEYSYPGDNAPRDALIKYYFEQSYTAKTICGILLSSHGIQISERHLRRIKKRLNLRRGNHPIERVVYAIDQLRKSGFDNIGFKAMWKLLDINCGIKVSQETVRLVLKALDPIGVEARSRNRLHRRIYTSRGPNFLIHIDGYDKLIPYGIGIHGAIDGFSRKLLWLKVGYSNKNPKLIAKLYMDHVKKYNCVPRVIRADAGSENVILKTLHMALRYDHGDRQSGTNSFITGRSVSNQRIERIWGNIRSWCIQFWRNLFRGMQNAEILLDTNLVHIECLRFCFIPLIQKHLDQFKQLWNSHRIRSQRNSDTITGIPNLLYYHPEVVGAHDYSFRLAYSMNALDTASDGHILDYPRFGCRDEFVEVIELITETSMHEFPFPCNIEDALVLYYHLTATLDTMIPAD